MRLSLTHSLTHSLIHRVDHMTMGGKFLAPAVECYEICIIFADVKDY
jgi:hypothetical protein